MADPGEGASVFLDQTEAPKETAPSPPVLSADLDPPMGLLILQWNPDFITFFREMETGLNNKEIRNN